jgi:hypothetical protein
MTFNTGIDLYRKNSRWVENVGITFASSTFTVTGSNGVALSSRNAAYIALPSLTSPGQVKAYRITSSQSFIDRTGASTINGNLFGFLTGDVQTTDVPFFLYAVSNSAAGSPETAISFMISRQAGRKTSPLVADIGKTGSSVADNDWSFFALDNPTVADYASCPCLMIGSFRMTKVALNDGWGVTTLDSKDGIGQYQQNRRFFLDTGVLGAKVGSHWLNNGGTAPTFNGAQSAYFIRPSGYIDANYTATTTSVNGAGAVGALVIVPMSSDYIFIATGTATPIHASGRLITTVTNTLMPTVAGNQSVAAMNFVNNVVDGPLINSVLGATVTNVNISCLYRPRSV